MIGLAPACVDFLYKLSRAIAGASHKFLKKCTIQIGYGTCIKGCGERQLSGTMKLKKPAWILAAILAISPYSAQADLIFGFSFDNVIGTTPGTIEGLITFDFLDSHSDSGTGAASAIEILSAPGAIPGAVEGNDVTQWMTQAINTFTILNGAIIDYQFGASEGAVPGLNDNVFCLNNGGFFVVGGVYICGPGENYYGDAFSYVYNVDGIGGVTFRAVPEPGTLALLGLGLAVLGLAARRRRPD